MIPGNINTALISGAEGGGYQIQRSLRFNSSDSGFCARTMSSASSTYTLSMWVKRSTLTSNYKYLFSSGNAGIAFYNGTDQFYIFDGSTVHATTGVYRDTSAWYHILLSVSGNTGAAYINGTQVLSGKNTASLSTTANATNIGRYYNSGSGDFYFDGYIADVYLIDGQALTPSSFTETSATTGQLIPKAYSGSFGTNGFWLKFSDNSAATATTLGKDYSGNSNNWTPNNLSVQGLFSYSSNVTTVATSIYNGTPATMFDGSTSTYYGVTSNNGSNSSITIDLTGKGVSVSTGIRVYGTYRNGMVWQINGNTVSSSGVSHPNTGWQTLSGWSAGVITSISVSVPSGSANEIYAIEINGVILTNSSGAGNDSTVDTPTSYGTDTGVGGEVRGNYATWNPLISSTNLTNGNLSVVQPGTTATSRYSTLGMSSGKWYWEITVVKYSNTVFGIRTPGGGILETPYDSSGYGMGWRTSGGFYIGGSNTGTGSMSLAAGDVLGLAFDADAGTLKFYKNGTLNNTLTASSTYIGQTWFAGSQDSGGGNSDHDVNFGQRSWAYAPPANHRPLVDTLLPTPVVAKPSTAFDVKLYTGNGGTQTISGLNFSPDLVWIKTRSVGYYHVLYDTVRGTGTGKALYSNTTDAEGADATLQNLTAFNSDGFSLGTTSGTNIINDSSQTRVAWTWDAGSSTVTNTQGSITSQVRANASAGFSIVTYTGTLANATVGHGLGAVPGLIIIKERSQGTGGWITYHSSIGATGALYLNGTTAVTTASSWYNNTAPTSTVFSLGANGELNDSGQTNVAYCFAPVAGYSAFGSYTGNGSTDGPFVYTGFRPRWVMIKQTSAATENWILLDSARDTYNQLGEYLNSNTSAAAASTGLADFLSNGFKLRVNTGAATNASAGTYIYCAFAEFPFQYARAR